MTSLLKKLSISKTLKIHVVKPLWSLQLVSFQIVDRIRRQSSWASWEFCSHRRSRHDATRQCVLGIMPWKLLFQPLMLGLWFTGCLRKKHIRYSGPMNSNVVSSTCPVFLWKYPVMEQTPPHLVNCSTRLLLYTRKEKHVNLACERQCLFINLVMPSQLSHAVTSALSRSSLSWCHAVDDVLSTAWHQGGTNSLDLTEYIPRRRLSIH